MRKIYTLFFVVMVFVLKGQNYNPIINYSFNGTPTNGVKIKTNIPYSDGSQMPNITIEGFNYGDSTPINLSIVWYIYGGNFTNFAMSTSSSYAPEVKLSNEAGKVVVFINDRQYYNRFSIRGFALGMGENAGWFSGWTITDESLSASGTNTVVLPYKNVATQTSNFPGGIWNQNGSVGIGTTTPQNKLDVNGTVHSKEVKVDMIGWADYVLKKDYVLPTLEEVEKNIIEQGHLENIPSTQEVLQEGLKLGEFQIKLLRKIEELTLYSIEQNKQNQELQLRMEKLRELTLYHIDLDKQVLSLEREIKTLRNK